MIDLTEHDKLGVRQCIGQPIARASEIEIADGDQRWARNCCELLGRERTEAWATHDRRKCMLVVAVLVGVLSEEAPDVVVGIAGAIERCENS